MTKLMEWVSVLVILGSFWLSLYLGFIFPNWSRDNKGPILGMPFVGVGLFGLYSVSTIAVRVANFNDCEEAAIELKREIREAKADLKKKGLKME